MRKRDGTGLECDRPMTCDAAAPDDAEAPPAPQRVVKVRRDYNSWVAQESLEDYALRYTPQSFRRWSELRVANTAFGAASFLVLEAVGATLLVQDGFVNTFWAILATGLVIALAGWPIALHAARHGLDMDLLTRGAGFGYLGSTVTSLVYASFTFIFFALEAAVMAYALELAFDLPPAWGYLACALVVLPLVAHGVTAIGRLQVWTQPLWLALLVLPYFFVFRANPHALAGLWRYAGEDGHGGSFDLLKFGAATTVGIALMTQMGEQADYLRFMPARTAANRRRWIASVAIGGPGWVLPGVLKMLGGALLAWLAIGHAVPADRAVDPNQMYLRAWDTVFPRPALAVAATTVFVVLSQLKINVTNAYAGSLAWSNFFARLTHSHPGRVVWVVFNTAIALMLMELDVFAVLGQVLGLYANIAISWLMAVVADLVVNKPLGLSPRGIEFRRAYLYDINPVGVGAMGIASVLGIAAHLGAFGALAQAFSALISLVAAFAASPAIAWATRGRYYLARTDEANASGAAEGIRPRLLRCCICERDYEGADTAHCPAYQGPICSLCCSLDARCGDLCKPHARLATQARDAAHALLPRRLWPAFDGGLGAWLALMLPVAGLLATVCALLLSQELQELGDMPAAASALRRSCLGVFAVLLLVAGVAGWWAVLARQSRRVAQEESNRQTQALGEQALLLRREIDSHRRTDAELQRAKAAADAANQAKSRYISTLSHELRTPLNSVIGYAQLLDDDPALPAHRRQAVAVIRRGGEHLLSLIEGTLDLARIEGGKVSLAIATTPLRDLLDELTDMFALQARAKGLRFAADVDDGLPRAVRTDERKLRQVLINVLGNAVKFTDRGEVRLRVRHEREIAQFDIEDTGPGIAVADLDRVFEPFARGSEAHAGESAGTGLGLTIAKMLVELMGGEMTVRSAPGAGTAFRIRLFLPAQFAGAWAASPAPRRIVAPAAASAASAPGGGVLPATAPLRALSEQVRLGYPRGIHRWLDHIDATEPACAEFTGRLRAMARQFRLEAMATTLAEALHDREAGRG